MGHPHRGPGGAVSAEPATQERHPSVTLPYLTLTHPRKIAPVAR